MIIIFIIVAFVVSFILLVFFLKNHFKVKNMLKMFKTCNCIVFGCKGTGKDLIFQYIINKRKKTYYSNINYGGKGKPINLNDVSVSPNTYVDFINGNTTFIKKDNKREAKDIYISDGGIYLPSYMDTTLYKQFPSFPIYYALSRHLYNSNVHINTQNLSRVWKSLREQSDFYVYCIQTIKLPFILITKCISYDRYESAEKKLRPLNARILNKFSKAEYDLYKAERGSINQFYVIQRKSKIKYDSRAFHKTLFGRKAPTN